VKTLAATSSDRREKSSISERYCWRKGWKGSSLFEWMNFGMLTDSVLSSTSVLMIVFSCALGCMLVASNDCEDSGSGNYSELFQGTVLGQKFEYTL